MERRTGGEVGLGETERLDTMLLTAGSEGVVGLSDGEAVCSRRQRHDHLLGVLVVLAASRGESGVSPITCVPVAASFLAFAGLVISRRRALADVLYRVTGATIFDEASPSGARDRAIIFVVVPSLFATSAIGVCLLALIGS